MKVNKYGIICALALLSGVVGCEDSSSLLDKEESNDIYENMVFSDPYNATWFLSNIYKSMNDGFMVFGSDDSGGFLGNAVDEGIWKANWDNAYKMSVGAWATTDMLLNYDPWKKYYTAIRAACRFLEHADEIPDSPEPFIDEGVRTRMKGEARFLRALFYYELLKFYGGVPIVTRVLGPDDAAELHGARAGFDEVVEFICSEAMLAAGDLPHVDEYADSEWGRATKGACYALISRVRLLAASPLFNDRQNPSGSACRGEYSAEKWKTAAEAAKYFLENTRGYALHRSTDPERYGDYEDLFLRRYSPEIILAYQQDQFAVRLERNCLPGQLFNYAFGVLNNFPTLNTVAEYEVVKLDDQGNVVSTHLLGLDKLLKLHETNGTDPESGFDPQNPYVNRAPRFYQSVWYNGEPWPARGTTAANTPKFESYVGGTHDATSKGFYCTGFFNRKFLDAWANLTGYGTMLKVNHNFIIFRYAEILLNYAEAVNEAFGDPDAVPAGYPMSAREAVNLVRERAKFPNYNMQDFKWPAGMPKAAAGKSISPLPAGLGQTEMRKRIVHERWIEFFQEEQRFFDLNRWKMRSPVTIYKQIITKSGDKFSFSVEPLITKTWKDKFYLFPIQEKEMNKSPLLEQNPGWGLEE